MHVVARRNPVTELAVQTRIPVSEDAGGIEQSHADGDLIEHIGQPRLAGAQLHIGLLAGGDIDTRHEPFADAAIGLHHRHGLGRHPRDAAIAAAYTVLEHDRAPALDACIDAIAYLRTILLGDVVGDPAPVRINHPRERVRTAQRAHLAPVRAHPVMHFGACCRQGQQSRFAGAQRALGPVALDEIGRRPCQQFQ
ncbi:hypothetical protein OZ10_15040 [Xanthomonas cannabis pv. cannabis]|nr:hypothetical protein OZ10_15040 [Xanthomonas cannabis pv. cannabis]